MDPHVLSWNDVLYRLYRLYLHFRTFTEQFAQRKRCQLLHRDAPWCTLPSGGTYSWSRRIFRKKSVGSDWGKICWNSISNRYLDAQVQTWRSRIFANADVKCTKNCVFSVFVLMSVMTSWINSVSWYAIYSCMTDWCNVFVLSEMVFIRLKKTLINIDTGQY